MKKGLYELVIIVIAILMFFLFSIKDTKKPYFPSVTSPSVSQYKPQPTTRNPSVNFRTTVRSTEEETDDERVFDDDDDYDNPDYDQDDVDELENY